MPLSQVFFYQHDDGMVPIRDWLVRLQQKNRKAFAKYASRIRLLRDLGHELRRPHADYLRDGIYELRVREGNVNYRLLYFFHGQNVCILTHGLTKERVVAVKEIDLTVEYRQRFEADPAGHTYEEQLDG